MTLKQLEAFYWAAKLGTFAVAALRLHVTQSSLSKRVAELEADLGQLLFDRNSRRLSLTAAGEILLVKAGPMLEFEHEIRASLVQQQQEVRGVCRFGLTELAATTWFPALAARIEQEHPGVTLEPQVGLSRTLEHAVQGGELDLATIAGPSTGREIRSKVILEVEFVWTASPSRLRRRTVLTPEQFSLHPIINNAHESGLTSLFEEWSRANGIRIGKTITCNSRAAIIALTVAGVGISFQPRKYVQPLFNRGLLVPLESEPPLPALPYRLIWRRDDNRDLLKTVLQLVEEEADFGSENLFWSAASA